MSFDQRPAAEPSPDFTRCQTGREAVCTVNSGDSTSACLAALLGELRVFGAGFSGPVSSSSARSQDEAKRECVSVCPKTKAEKTAVKSDVMGSPQLQSLPGFECSSTSSLSWMLMQRPGFEAEKSARQREIVGSG